MIAVYLLLAPARRGQAGEGRGAQYSPRNRLPRQSMRNRSRRANRSRRSITSRREPFFPDDAVPAVSPTGCRCNCPFARNLRQSEVALAARMGSGIAVQRPRAFRLSPGNVHRPDIAGPLAIRSREAAQECFDPPVSSTAAQSWHPQRLRSLWTKTGFLMII